VEVPAARQEVEAVEMPVAQQEAADERGNCFSGPVHDFPFCVPVGSHAPHAAGVAYALKLRKEPRVAVCMFGRRTRRAICARRQNSSLRKHRLSRWRHRATNNQWAISVPLRLQTRCETLAQKAIAAGFT
jgi:pyruvate dehydrogenase E1 component alpha subunit